MVQASVDSSKRAWLKPAEVCELAQVQPYVLRTWEMEFADLGVARTPGGPRVYRRADVDRVLRIKQLVFGEGLTLAGARRRIEEDRAGGDELPFDDEPAPPRGKLPADARKRIAAVREELRKLLALLSRPGDGHAGTAGPPAAGGPTGVPPARAASSARGGRRNAERARSRK